jgi:hypothetical protein
MNLGTESVSVGFGGLPERRATTRFPVREEVKYKLLHRRSEQASGTGQTVNIGSGGILFTTEEKLPVGRMVELSVNWPARLHGTCPLKFVALGRVVRSEAHSAAIQVEKYQFKTRGTLSGTASNGTASNGIKV